MGLPKEDIPPLQNLNGENFISARNGMLAHSPPQ